jgi:hypothetical protein
MIDAATRERIAMVERVRRILARARFMTEMKHQRIPERQWRFIESGESMWAVSPDGMRRTYLGDDRPAEIMIAGEWVPEDLNAATVLR